MSTNPAVIVVSLLIMLHLLPTQCAREVPVRPARKSLKEPVFADREFSVCPVMRTIRVDMRNNRSRPGGLRPRGPPMPSLAGPHDPRSAPAGAPVARLARYAARPQRAQNSRCEPHNDLMPRERQAKTVR